MLKYQMHLKKNKKITLTEPVVSMQRRSCLHLRSQASSERGLVPSLAKRCLRTFCDAQSASRRQCQGYYKRGIQ
jgi:hypothetical protein